MIENLPVTTKKRKELEILMDRTLEEIIDASNEDPEEYFKTVVLRADLDKLDLEFKLKRMAIERMKQVLNSRLRQTSPDE